MASPTQQERAVDLANEAVRLVASGKAEDGSRALREAISLAPDAQQVQQAFAKLQLEDTGHLFANWCARFVEEKDVTAGREALAFVSSQGAHIPAAVATDCLQQLIDAIETTNPSLRDQLVAGLLLYCRPARLSLAAQLQKSVHRSFERVFVVGDGAANALSDLVLDQEAWQSEALRNEFERDVFQLFVAKLLESGHDYDGRAIRGMARSFALHADTLHGLLDEESFGAVLELLDFRLKAEVRSQAILVTAKYLEAAQERGHQSLSTFVNAKIVHGTNEDLVKAFSIVASVFPLAPSEAAGLFLTKGFLPSLVPLLDTKARSLKVEKAALNMLNAACVDKSCREAIAKDCTEWMNHILELGEDERQGQAAVILAKVQTFPEDQGDQAQPGPVKMLIPMLMEMLVDGAESERSHAIEGLAYASMQPGVRDELTRNVDVLHRLFHPPVADAVAVLFGALTLIDNLTRYLPSLSEEQKRMAQLKAYANASKPSDDAHPREQDEQVDLRCKAAIAEGVLTYLNRLRTEVKGLSQACLDLVARIMLSLSKLPESRGTLAQQGAIPLLLYVFHAKAAAEHAKQVAAHAMARILISVDPQLVMNHIAQAIPPLLSLLSADDTTSDGPRDLLPVFEALLALTNAASYAPSDAGAAIVPAAFARIEDLLLSNNTLVQRAAAELACNLMTYAEGIEKLADGSPTASRRLHLFLALADVDDVPTRQAAGGALAVATAFEAVALSILGWERGVDILLGLCEDADPGCVHRGIVCISNLVLMDGEVGRKTRGKILSCDGIEALKSMMKQSRQQAVLDLGVEALKALLAQQVPGGLPDPGQN